MLRGLLSPGNREARRGASAGFTLAEVLVAVAVFAVVSAIALTLYQQLQKSFKSGENAASQQQNTRIAFDRLIADLRMAGFNYNPDGDVSRPDEQIEGMWRNALTIRGDFDFETTDATTPESTLGGAGMTFGIVSTANDEIVTYALGKPSGIGGTSLQFQADVSSVPRDGTVETVTITNVYLDMNSPPYTLYRIALKPAGAPLSNMGDKQPVADNIRSLVFTYYDGAGNVLGTMAGGMDTTTAMDQRKRIAKIGVRIVGMTQDPDRNYQDPTDTNPLSRNYRKFELASDVTPRNLGFVGIPDLDLEDPNMPTGLSVCAGHCEGLWTTWNANDPAEGVVKYEITYGASALSQGNAQDAFGTSLYMDGLDPNGTYVVGLAAVDAGGNKSQRAFSPSTAMSNTTEPAPPTSLAGTSTGAGNALTSAIDVGWTAPMQNTAATALACDGAPSTPLRDLAGYRLYRGAVSGFDPNVPAQVQASWDPNTLGGGDPDPNVTDTAVVNCRTYYYKAVAEDLCGFRSTVATGSGSASSATLPEAPLNVTAMDLGLGTSQITWDPVVLDTLGNAVLIDTYKVWRAHVPAGNDPNMAVYSLQYDGPVVSVGTPAYLDVNAPAIPPTEDYYYRITARDDCPNESAESIPALLTQCSFGGTIMISMSPGGYVVSSTQTITVTVSPGVIPVQGGIVIRDSNTGQPVFQQMSTSYPYAFTWNASSVPPGHYDIVAAVTNDQGCTETTMTSVISSTPGLCCVGVANPSVTDNTTLGSILGGTKNNELGFDLLNNCTTDIAVEGIKATWEDLASKGPQLASWTFQGFPNVVLSPPVNPFLSGITPLADFDLVNDPRFTPYPMGPGSTATVSYIFTKAMAWKQGQVNYGNILRIQYAARQPMAPQQRCSISVVPDVTSPGLVLCDPTLDPNCPGF